MVAISKIILRIGESMFSARSFFQISLQKCREPFLFPGWPQLQLIQPKPTHVSLALVPLFFKPPKLFYVKWTAQFDLNLRFCL